MKKKLSSKKGFSLTEMLVAVLILGLVTGSVATGITASIPIYQKAVALSESEMLSSTLSQALMDELRYATEPRKTNAGSETLDTYTSSLHGRGARLRLNGEGKVEVMDGKLLIGDGSYSDLTVSDLSILYHESDGFFDVSFSVGRNEKKIINTFYSVRILNP